MARIHTYVIPYYFVVLWGSWKSILLGEAALYPVLEEYLRTLFTCVLGPCFVLRWGPHWSLLCWGLGRASHVVKTSEISGIDSVDSPKWLCNLYKPPVNGVYRKITAPKIYFTKSGIQCFVLPFHFGGSSWNVHLIKSNRFYHYSNYIFRKQYIS